MYKQLILVRRDLPMSPGKLAAQVSHASMAFLLSMIKQGHYWTSKYEYDSVLFINKELYDEWINGSMTKIVCGARNRSRLLKAIEKAKNLGMEEGRDFFLIHDVCRTELSPEGPEGTLTCVGFAPMEAEHIDQIGKEFHLL